LYRVLEQSNIRFLPELPLTYSNFIFRRIRRFLKLPVSFNLAPQLIFQYQQPTVMSHFPPEYLQPCLFSIEQAVVLTYKQYSR